MKGLVRVLIVFLAVAFRLAAGAADLLVEALRDAQAQSKAMTLSGRCRAKIAYWIYREEGKGRLNPPNDPQNVLGEVDALLAWSDTSFSIEYHAEGWCRQPIGFYSPNKDDRDRSVLNGEISMHYDQYSNRLKIMPRAQTDMPGVLDINPRRAWYHCCPPYTAPGRPWNEVLDYQPPAAVGVTVRYETIDHHDGTICRVRTGSDGGVSNIDYSLVLGGNPIKAHYRDANVETLLTYEWLTLRPGVFVPSRIRETKKIAGELVSDYSITYSDHQVSSEGRPADFSLDAVRRTLPRDVFIQDERPGARKTARKTDGVDEAALRQLIEKNKSAGFAAP